MIHSRKTPLAPRRLLHGAQPHVPLRGAESPVGRQSLRLVLYSPGHRGFVSGWPFSHHEVNISSSSRFSLAGARTVRHPVCGGLGGRASALCLSAQFFSEWKLQRHPRPGGPEPSLLARRRAGMLVPERGEVSRKGKTVEAPRSRRPRAEFASGAAGRHAGSRAPRGVPQRENCRGPQIPAGGTPILWVGRGPRKARKTLPEGAQRGSS